MGIKLDQFYHIKYKNCTLFIDLMYIHLVVLLLNLLQLYCCMIWNQCLCLYVCVWGGTQKKLDIIYVYKIEIGLYLLVCQIWNRFLCIQLSRTFERDKDPQLFVQDPLLGLFAIPDHSQLSHQWKRLWKSAETSSSLLSWASWLAERKFLKGYIKQCVIRTVKF